MRYRVPQYRRRSCWFRILWKAFLLYWARIVMASLLCVFRGISIGEVSMTFIERDCVDRVGCYVAIGLLLVRLLADGTDEARGRCCWNLKKKEIQMLIFLLKIILQSWRSLLNQILIWSVQYQWKYCSCHVFQVVIFSHNTFFNCRAFSSRIIVYRKNKPIRATMAPIIRRPAPRPLILKQKKENIHGMFSRKRELQQLMMDDSEKKSLLTEFNMC